MESMSGTFVEESKGMELFKMKNELIMFVNKMKSEGFLASVDYEDIEEMNESEITDW